MNDIVEKVLQGDVRSAARLIRDLDDGAPRAREYLKELFPHAGKAYVLGITGSPGVGKSTLTDSLVAHLRQAGKTVGVLAVDPTSPFSGGAILGDRVRMQRHSTDEGVFIRSMATRGQFGGLTQATRAAITVLDAMGKDVVIVETVGVGQDEVDIARTAHTTIIVAVPGLGDDIQAIKAGILEVGDVFVVNKADREGADRTVQDLRNMIEMSHDSNLGRKDWTPPILKAVANRNEGIEDIWNAAQKHRDFLSKHQSEYYSRLQRMNHKMELIDLIKQGVVDRVLRELEENGQLDQYVDDLVENRIDPYTLSEEILNRFFADTD
jgi:LAO/AO transport system kinase